MNRSTIRNNVKEALAVAVRSIMGDVAEGHNRVSKDKRMVNIGRQMEKLGMAQDKLQKQLRKIHVNPHTQRRTAIENEAAQVLSKLAWAITTEERKAARDMAQKFVQRLKKL